MPAERFSQPLDGFRDYLLLLARMNLGKKYQGKLDASDIVQQALLEAHRAQDNYRGASDGEFAAWLRKILAHTLCRAIRDLGRTKRDVDREVAARVDASSLRLEALLVADQ